MSSYIPDYVLFYIDWRMVTLSQPVHQNIIRNKINIYLFLALYNFLKYFFPQLHNGHKWFAD